MARVNRRRLGSHSVPALMDVDKAASSDLNFFFLFKEKIKMSVWEQEIQYLPTLVLKLSPYY